MSKRAELAKFYEDLGQEILNKAAMDETEDFQENIFTQIYMDYLTEAAEVEDGNLSYHESRGIKINGYSLPEDESSLVLFVSIYKNSPSLYSVPPSDVATMLNRLKQFFIKSLSGYHGQLEEAYSAFDIAQTIYEGKDRFNVVKLVLLTNGTVRDVDLDPEEEGEVTFIKSVWDIERIYRVSTSGNAREKIEINLKELTGKNLECIRVDVPNVPRKRKDGVDYHSGGYTSYFTVIPGDVLYKIYQEYDARLLEKNVRAFLQARGGVNKGIKATIQNIPEMFLAYNNGISATAESVDVEAFSGTYCVITGLKDFQIVNGGQTTASIFNACIKDKTPLRHIFVQAKITVLNDTSRMDEVVPLISKCANTQNKVQMADFSANDPFHQAVEELSRTVWAPAKTGGQRQTKWFYERSRGQYADIRSREKNTKYFDSIYPKNQYFDKIALARYENLWDQRPHIASKGGQANFRDFMLRLKERVKFVPDQGYYENLIAKAILYRETKQLIKSAGVPTYWSNIADYTVAFLSYKTAQRIDLKSIWKAQDLPGALELEIKRVAHFIYDYLVKSSVDKNTTQWCKQEACWKGLLAKPYEISDQLSQLLVKIGNKVQSATAQNIHSATDSERGLIEQIMRVDRNIWLSISSWGKETKALQPFQNGIAYTLGRYAGWKKEPSYKQAKQGVRILLTAREKGFVNDSLVDEVLSKFSSELD